MIYNFALSQQQQKKKKIQEEQIDCTRDHRHHRHQLNRPSYMNHYDKTADSYKQASIDTGGGGGAKDDYPNRID